MGHSHEFRCPRCHYETTASGGPDVGELVRTVTISCKTCRKPGGGYIGAFLGLYIPFLDLN